MILRLQVKPRIFNLEQKIFTFIFSAAVLYIHHNLLLTVAELGRSLSVMCNIFAYLYVATLLTVNRVK